MPVAKRVRQLTLLNCSLATCFAAEVDSKLHLLEVSFKFSLNILHFTLVSVATAGHYFPYTDRKL